MLYQLGFEHVSGATSDVEAARHRNRKRVAAASINQCPGSLAPSGLGGRVGRTAGGRGRYQPGGNTKKPATATQSRMLSEPAGAAVLDGQLSGTVAPAGQ